MVKKVKDTLSTHEGGRAVPISDYLQLRRSVLACLLWEKEFYEDGISISQRIADLIPRLEPASVSALAIEAREKMKLRHIPLFLVREMTRHNAHKAYVEDTLARVIQRADELSEFLAIYWKDGRSPIAASAKRGLARAFKKFNEYALAKYDRDGEIKLRDVLNLIHPKPDNADQSALWKKVLEGMLDIPNTWETRLSAGEDKKAVFTDLVIRKRLGGLAFLRNLRNMIQAGVEPTIIRNGIMDMNAERILPYRFIAAQKYAPDYTDVLEAKMFACLADHEKLEGRTAVMVDVSGSMDWAMASKSDLERLDTALGLSMLVKEICEDAVFYSFSDRLVKIKEARGFKLASNIRFSQTHNGTSLRSTMEELNTKENYNRLIVITDEQSHDGISRPKDGSLGYVINVASNRNGVGYGDWVHIDGFSEAVVSYIQAYEKEIVQEAYNNVGTNTRVIRPE